MLSAYLARCFACVLAALLAVPAGVTSQQALGTKRVLMLYGHDPNAPGVMAFTNSLQVAIRDELPGVVEFYYESLDLDRFPDPDRWEPLLLYLGEKYRGVGFDAIATEGSWALRFATDRLGELFAGVPVVYALAFEPIVDFDLLPDHVTGRYQPLPFAGTLALARSLQPDAQRVFLIGGASPMDSLLFDNAVRDLTPSIGNLGLVTMRDWTYPSLLVQLRQLPPRSIAILSSFSGDQLGQRFNSGDLIASVTRAASAPVYGISRNWVGDGIVGGAVMDFAEDGRRAGMMLIDILGGSPGDPMPTRETADTPLVVDWRQLERWGLSERLLPPGSEVLFRPPTIWARYWAVIVVALGVIAAQSALIALLLLERRKRMQALRAVEEGRGQIAHIARVATLGELAATVSHELRQPLAAIRVQAEAGALLMTQARADPSEAREIFEEIGAEGVRASEIIDHTRTLLRKDEPVKAPVDINGICRQATKLLDHDAARRGVRLRLSLEQGLPPVTGDAVQLQQVVLNLALNALDAVQTAGRGQEVVVGTTAGAGNVQIFVRDTGPGLPPETQERVFDPFFSTKSHGLGMGLAIVRSIVERHDGRVGAHNDPEGGAIFRVELPSAEPPAEPRASGAPTGRTP